MYTRKDHYYKKAKEEGRVSRASYKFEHIQEKFKIVKKGDKIVDLGCAPGSWFEVISKMIGDGGFIVGVDLLPIKVKIPKNGLYIEGDILDLDVQGEVAKAIHGKADVIVSDMAPNTSGLAFKDCYISYELTLTALEVVKVVLKKGGSFATKIFQGAETEILRKDLKKLFAKVSTYIPPSTRKNSKEIYIVAIGFKG